MIGTGYATNYIQITVEANCGTYITGETTLYTIQGSIAKFLKKSKLNFFKTERGESQMGYFKGK
ncbi:hypothetical protein [Bacillus pseudomycoides]|uniref:hypothetical protein n=1 Tax=Bacillus pseudomycoides TaxID=64104 RepID=UPI000BEBA4D4|nr:hypothetical protein [Bacillus pseudomycoides]PEA80558.1 hypothetical protein CON99_27585 [Bacillus pseudomycoides]PHA49714.1 hypothetical protein COE76_26380 [Bacillus pseudomycoides]